MPTLAPLPIDPALPQIVETLRHETALVLVAPPGAGKTTRVPPALQRAGVVEGQVIVLQPRRVAARAAARRIAAEQGWRLGEEVGYQVRLDACVGPRTVINIVTEGILTRRLQDDPLLEHVGAVILDEFHERSLHTDLALALLRELQRARPELRLVVMSATLAAEPVRGFLGGCPSLAVEGRRHPLEISYLERPDARPVAERAAAGVRRALREAAGDVLVFLPGAREIRHVAELLAPSAEHVALRLLHGSLPLEEQDLALQPAARRKVILSTNVAETSLTIDGVTVVVDSGRARILRHDSRYGIDRLELVAISRASADQRAGRAGRTAPGRVYRLWTRAEHASLAAQTVPEIRRVDLAGSVLAIRAWGGDPLTFPWFEPPEQGALRGAESLLGLLGALDGARLTALGRQLAALPLHPRLGRLLIEAHRRGCPGAGADLAALLAEREILNVGRDVPGRPRSALESGASDLLLRLERLEEARRADHRPTLLASWGIDAAATQHVSRVAAQLRAIARSVLGATVECPAREEELLRLVVAGYPDRICCRRAPGSARAVMVGGRGVVLDERSVVRDAAIFVAVTLDGAGAEAHVQLASAVAPAWLPLREEVRTRYDGELERVVAGRQRLYEDLVLDESPLPASGEEAARLLAARVARDPLGALRPREEAAELLARARCLGRWMPELGLPVFDDAQLVALLPEICAGAVSLADLRRRDLLPFLRAALSPAQRGALARHAPERFEVPSGSRLRLHYAEDQLPVLAVRLQEVFGLSETPRVAGGRVPVLLHLLGPNGRPVQITQDLRSFWERTYPEVRRELRRRYPRHAWPEDPRVARPAQQPGRRR
jgi:ATP-dependent helicase HrpB